jgi:SAM-dependent methyltransferase
LQSQTPSSAPVKEHFRRKALSFDALYDEQRLLQRKLRPGLIRRRQLAVEAVESYDSPRVLDIGCGSGRVGEFVLAAGAGEYVGVDFSDTMLALAAERLKPYGKQVRLVEGDFLEADLSGPFEIVLALGFFDYIPDTAPFLKRIGELCSGSLVASFPGWSRLKGPIRKLRYELLHRVKIFDYTEPQLRQMLAGAGFSEIRIDRPGSGYLVHARR